MTNKDIERTYGILQGMEKKRLPVKISFAIARNARQMEGICEDIDKCRKDLIRKHADKDEAGEVILNEKDELHIKAENMDALNRELTELLDADTEVEIHCIRQEDLERCDEEMFDSLTPEDAWALVFMIEEDE